MSGGRSAGKAAHEGAPGFAVTALTPAQRGGIGVLVLWGGKAEERVRRFFPALADESIMYGRLRDEGGVIDEVLLWEVPAADAGTGAAEIEISFHGGPVARGKMLKFWAGRGAELRSYETYLACSDRYDRIQKEALAALPAAKTERQLLFLLKQRDGRLSCEVRSLSAAADREHYARELRGLLGSCEMGIRMVAGLRVLIAGPPNSGKSTLMNRLCGRDRSIVTDVPGTTRDMLEASGTISGIPVVYVDTCGIAPGGTAVEQMGTKNVFEEMRSADVALFLGIDPATVPGRPRHSFFLAPKADLGGPVPSGALPVSGLTGQGVDELTGKIETAVFEGAAGCDALPFTHRQKDVLREAESLLQGESLEMSKRALEKLL